MELIQVGGDGEGEKGRRREWDFSPLWRIGLAGSWYKRTTKHNHKKQPCTTIRTIMHSTFMAESWYNHSMVLSAIVHPFISNQVPCTNCRKFPACGITIPLLWQKKGGEQIYHHIQQVKGLWVIESLRHYPPTKYQNDKQQTLDTVWLCQWPNFTICTRPHCH